MSRFVVLFRGINVGKAKRIAMADLRALFESLGYRDVCTLLNSGNVIFTARATSAARLSQNIRSAVATELGVDALVIVKSAAEISAAIAEHPFKAIATDPSRLLVAFTHDANSLAALKTWGKTDWNTERVHIGQHAAFLWCAEGILKSKAGEALLKGLAGSGTTRNWATLERIHGLSGD